MTVHLGDSLPILPGFILGRVLGHGASSVVYEGVRGGKTFAVKVLNKIQAQGSDASLIFRREAATLAVLSHPSLVQVIEVNEFQGLPYLVMERVLGENLAQILTKGSLNETQLIRVAKDLASALASVHGRSLVHRDIKPANIMVQPDGMSKIIDFGFAIREEDEKNEEDSDVTLGTLLYSAPEQTGMLKRPLDGRSDLYSLGCLLFECAVGNPPFQATHVAELMQKHLTATPSNIHELNPEIRPILAQIVAKLMAKDPDDRYQTAEGLLADLESMDQLTELDHKGPRFGLKSKHPLIGRTKEIAELKELWEKTKRSAGTIVQIEGEGGSGKTRLIRELLELARSQGALILNGKAYQGEQIPFGPLREAINQHVTNVNKLDTEKKRSAVEQLQRSAGDWAHLVKRLSRSLELIFKDTKEIPPLDPVNEQARFYKKIAEFFIHFARVSGTCILFIDDVQWLDQGSLEIIKQMKIFLSQTPLLVVTASRNDPASEAAREKFVKAMGGLENQLVLQPLSIEAVRGLITSHLGGRSLESSLVDKISIQAKGNPFVIGEYIRSLLESGALRPTENGWVIDKERLEEIHLPTEVIQLLIDRIKVLSKESSQILAFASIIGFEFQLNLLEVASNRSSNEIWRAIEEGLKSNLIERTDKGYSYIHDRVYEAFSTYTDNVNRKDANQAIAEYLDRIDDSSFAHMFALARHYSQGHIDKNPKRVYETSLAAGQLALENFSNEEAFQLLSQSFKLFEKTGLENRALVGLYGKLGTTCTRTGRYKDAHEYFQKVLSLSEDQKDLARTHTLIGFAHYSSGKFGDATQEFEHAFQTLGVSLPKSKAHQKLTFVSYITFYYFLVSTGFGLGKAKGSSRDSRKTITEIYGLSKLVYYMLGDMPSLAQLAIRDLVNAHFLGVSTTYAKAIVTFSSSILALRGPKSKSKVTQLCSLACSMAEQLGSLETIAYCKLYYGISLEFCGESIDGHALIKEALPTVVKYSATSDVAIAISVSANFSFHQGRSREVVDFIRVNLPEMVRTGNINFQIGLMSHLYSQLFVLGQTQEALKIKSEIQKLIVAIPQVKMAQVFRIGAELLVLLDQEDFGIELDQLLDTYPRVMTGTYYTRYVDFLVAYSRLDHYLREKDTLTRQKARKTLEDAIEFAKRTCLTPILRCHVLAVEGALATEDGKYRKAHRLLLESEALAKKVESHWGLWRVYREKARLAQRQGDTNLTKQFANAALELAKAQGWANRAKQIRRDFSIQEGEGLSFVQSQSQNISRASASSNVTIINQQRSLDALLRLSVASARILDPDLQARQALDETIHILGAERAFLFLLSPGVMKLEIKSGRDAQGNNLFELSNYSTTVIDRVKETRKPLIVSGTDEGEALGSQSAVAHNLRSIMATPVEMGDRMMGVLYLDSRVVKGLFSEEDLNLFQAMANHIAVSLETARAAQTELEKQALVKDLESKRAIQTILDNLDQGYFTFDSTGIIHPGVSHSAFELFQTDPEGKRLNDILLLDPKEKESLRQLIPHFFEERVPFSTVKSLAPKSCISSKERYIALDYRPIRGVDRKIEKVILISTDKTRERELQKKAQSEADFAKMIIQILRNRSAFVRFLINSRQRLELMESEFQEKEPQHLNIEELRRTMHTIKGEAAFFRVNQLKDRAHYYEEKFVQLTNLKDQSELLKVASEVRASPSEMKDLLERFCHDHSKYIGVIDPKNTKKERLIPMDEIDRMAQDLGRILPQTSSEYRKFYESFILQPIEENFRHFEGVVLDLAEIQKKEVDFQIIQSSPPIRVRSQAYEGLLDTMIHAFRNAVDHGIELPNERRKSAKDPRGKIQVSFDTKRDTLMIQVSDDGNGIDPQAISTLAIQKGLLKSEKLLEMSSEEVIQLVFNPGFSSKTEVTDVSGRGVGLGTILAEAKKLSGRAFVQSQKGRGSCLIVEVPVFL